MRLEGLKRPKRIYDSVVDCYVDHWFVVVAPCAVKHYFKTRPEAVHFINTTS